MPGAAVLNPLRQRVLRVAGSQDRAPGSGTALPFGIDAELAGLPSFSSWGPSTAKRRTQSSTWHVGLSACLLSGLFEAARRVRRWVVASRHSARRASLGSRRNRPDVHLGGLRVPDLRPPLNSALSRAAPRHHLCVADATALRRPRPASGHRPGDGMAWALRTFNPRPSFEPYARRDRARLPSAGSPARRGLVPPSSIRARTGTWPSSSPMGLFNVIGSLQNLEGAEAAGDRYRDDALPVRQRRGHHRVRAVRQPIPNDGIYIGHPAWKAMGARRGYSILNGVAVTVLSLLGGLPLVLRVVPIDAVLGILLWIGLVMTAQAFQEVPREHALAVAFVLHPVAGGLGAGPIETSLRAAGSSLYEVAPRLGPDFALGGIIALRQGLCANVDDPLGGSRLRHRPAFLACGGVGRRRVGAVDAWPHARVRAHAARGRESIRLRGGAGLRRHLCRRRGLPRGAAFHWRSPRRGPFGALPLRASKNQERPGACHEQASAPYVTCHRSRRRVSIGGGCAMKDERHEKPHRRTNQSAGERQAARQAGDGRALRGHRDRSVVSLRHRTVRADRSDPIVIPRTKFFGAALLGMIMVGAVLTHLFILHNAPTAPAVLFLLAGIVAWGRRGALKPALSRLGLVTSSSGSTSIRSCATGRRPRRRDAAGGRSSAPRARPSSVMILMFWTSTAERRARVRPPAAHEDRARSALALIAASLGARHADAVAEGVEQRGVGMHAQRPRGPVHVERDVNLAGRRLTAREDARDGARPE